MTRTISRTCMVAMLSIGVTAYAQTTGQTPTQPSSQAGSSRMEQGRQSGDRSQTEQQITLVGCIQREAEYRQANKGGRGSATGTTSGTGTSGTASGTTSTSPSSTTSHTQHSGMSMASGGTAYALTGD